MIIPQWVDTETIKLVLNFFIVMHVVILGFISLCGVIFFCFMFADFKIKENKPNE